jgi:hypothetical protein
MLADDPCTFDDVMLDWAVAEIVSPTWKTNWQGSGCDTLRSKLLAGQLLSPPERGALLGGIQQTRAPLIQRYKVSPSWRFHRRDTTLDEVSRFSVLSDFGYGPSSFAWFAAKIKDNPSDGDRPMRSQALEMLELARRGNRFHGSPIAVEAMDQQPPVLVEGYKRCLVALWQGAASIQLFFCHP